MAKYFESKTSADRTIRPRPGLVSTVYGLTITAVLVLTALFGSRISAELEDPSRSLQPPYLEPLERALYDPLAECTFEPFFGDVDESHGLKFDSSPPLTSVIGKRYTYYPEVGDGGSDAGTSLAVEEGPSGFTVTPTGNAFEWTPERAGRFCVTVSARRDAEIVYQTYAVFASDRAHWLGTDRAGRDLVLALAAGARWALFPGLIMALLAIGLGTLVGGVGGYYGGAVDDFFHFVTAVIGSIPGLLLLFLVAVLSAFNVYVTIAALALLWMPRTARSVRASVSALKNRDFVEACRELGQSDAEILWREIVWANDRNQLLAQFFQAVGFAIVIEVTISYLGLGVKLPDISWGALLKEGRDMAIQANIYWIVTTTAVTVLIVVHGLNSLGRGLISLFGREGSRS